MHLLRKISLAAAAILFCLSLFAISGQAQPGRASWYGNNGRHLGWSNGRHNGSYKWRKHRLNNRNGYWDKRYDARYRYGNYSSGSSILDMLGLGSRRYGTRDRYYYGNRYYSDKQRRKLWKNYYKHRRDRDRDWDEQ